MEITEKLLERIETYGSRNYPVSYIVRLECKTKVEREFLRSQFDNPDSEVSDALHRGFVKRENEIDEFLEKSLEDPGEGAGDVAKALNFRRKNRQLDELKKELFGV